MSGHSFGPSLDAIEQSATNKKIAAEGFIHKFVYYVIGLEVVVCGYILSNSSKLSSFGYLLPAIYSVCGLAVLTGLIYKYLDNNIYQQRAYNPDINFSKKALRAYKITTNAFFILSFLFLLMLLIAGTIFLTKTIN